MSPFFPTRGTKRKNLQPRKIWEKGLSNAVLDKKQEAVLKKKIKFVSKKKQTIFAVSGFLVLSYPIKRDIKP